jgi:hypothetical protein
MNIEKANWHNSESKINLSFPIAKVDKEKRTVSGFATLDNVDHHGDVVTAEASEKAFASFRGNLREMHAPIAVGKVLSFQPEDFFDKKTGKTYKGIYVNAYVSKGAQDTWEKVLDGTMTGFSIGGNIITASNEVGDDNNDRRVIKEYDLMELSLVDSPANPLANIFSIQKNASGQSFIKGMAVDTNIENVHWCKSDQIASSSTNEIKNCVVCGNKMENIGWIESSDTEKGLLISKAIDAYLKKDDAPNPSHDATTHDADPQNTINSDQTINLHPDQNTKEKFLFNDGTKINKSEESLSKGGNEMTDENKVEAAAEEVAVETTEAAEVKADAPAEAPAEAAEEVVEKSVTSVESTDSFAKMLTDLRNLFDETLTKNSADSAEKIQKSVDTVEAARAEMYKSIEDLHAKHTELSGNISEMFKRVDALESRISSYESDTAVKKSIGDVDSAPKDSKITKSIWQGSFLGAQNL